MIKFLLGACAGLVVGGATVYGLIIWLMRKNISW